MEFENPEGVKIQTVVGYFEEAENIFERFDSKVLSESASDNIYSLSHDNVKLAIQGRKGGFSDSDVIPLGVKLFEEGKYKDATNLFTIAIEKYLARNSILVYDAFYYRGMCMYRLGNYAGALKNLQNAAKYYSDNGEILTLIDELTIKTSTKKSLND